MTPQTPSSGPSDHLLPHGEKGSSECGSGTMPPSPLAGEGARRAGEGGDAAKHERLKTFARSMRHAPTEAERQLWLLLRNRRLVDFKFRRQVPIDHFIADFVCFSARLIVELDGGQHAESTYDTARDAYLRAQGFRILRIWNSDILARPDAVLDAVWAALHEAQS